MVALRRYLKTGFEDVHCILRTLVFFCRMVNLREHAVLVCTLSENCEIYVTSNKKCETYFTICVKYYYGDIKCLCEK